MVVTIKNPNQIAAGHKTAQFEIEFRQGTVQNKAS